MKVNLKGNVILDDEKAIELRNEFKKLCDIYGIAGNFNMHGKEVHNKHSFLQR